MRILGVVSSSSREVPNAPTIGTATDIGTARAFNNGAATVSFTAPAWTGGLPITSYTATSNPGGLTATGGSSPLTVAGLASSTAYTFTVRATNAVGQSSPSAASNSITATTVPQAPTIGTATDGGTGSTVSVAFTPGANGGKTVTTYTATSSPGGLTGTSASSPITVSGLTAGTAYTFTVTATNANGTSAASAASNSVTPAVPTSYESIATLNAGGSSTVSFTSIPSTYKHLQIRYIGIASNASSTARDLRLAFNDDAAGSSYDRHTLQGNGTSASASNSTSTGYVVLVDGITGGTATSFGVGVIDIIDYQSTSKNKTVRSFFGTDQNGASTGYVKLASALWRNTNAITKITITNDIGAFGTGSTFALYGIKG